MIYSIGPTKLVQHFAYRGSSYRRKGAARHIIDWGFGYMPLANASGDERDILLVQIIFTCLRGTLNTVCEAIHFM